MEFCSVRMPLLSFVEDRAVSRHIHHSPEPHDPINGVVAVGDQQKRARPEFTRPLPRDRLDSARLKPRKVEASGGRLGDKTHRSEAIARVPVIAVLNIAFL